jgi:two-component system sensor histidine kinase/response regulator
MTVSITGTLLVVDDEESHGIIIAKLLRSKGFTVFTANSIQEGLRLIADVKPDLICTDLHIPGVTPAEVVENFSVKWPQIPVVVLTGSVRVDDAVTAMKCGAKDFIIKSFDEHFADVLLISISRSIRVAQLEEQQKRRERFQRELLATVTHDLRGPLTAIVLSGDLVARRIEDKSLQDAAHRIVRTARRSIELVDTYLTACQAEEGYLVLRPIATELKPVIHQVYEEYLSLSERAEIKLDIRLSVITWTLDVNVFHRVLNNLVSNAMRYSPKGGTVSLTVDEEPKGWLLVSVSDEGPGIPQEYLAELFLRFRRVSPEKYNPELLQKASNKRIEKTLAGGLGLYVVSMLVTSSGGTVEVANGKNSGAVFSFRLPIDPPVNSEGVIICAIVD